MLSVNKILLVGLFISITFSGCSDSNSGKYTENMSNDTEIQNIRRKLEKSENIEVYHLQYGDNVITQSAYYTNGDRCTFRYTRELENKKYETCTYYVPMDKIDINKIEVTRSGKIRLPVKYGKKLIKVAAEDGRTCYEAKVDPYINDAYFLTNNLEEGIDLLKEYVRACQTR